ncbi:trimeric LpxA-like protein, partial [Saccharata proteae CBS 121410]
ARPSASKRSSTAHPRAPVVIHHRAIIANHALLTGHHPISISVGAVLHPYCKISSLHAPVAIEEGCIIGEKAQIGLGNGGTMKGLKLAKNVVVDSSAIVEATQVGEGTHIGAGAKLGMGAVIGKYCTIAPQTVVLPNEEVPDFTVLFGAGQRRLNTTMQNRLKVTEQRNRGQKKQLDALALLIPSDIAKW